MAAEDGKSDAQFWLALCCDGGRGVDQDHLEAVKLCRPAVESGDGAAQRGLGISYVESLGAELDCLELVTSETPQLLFASLAIASAMANALLRLLMYHDEQSYDEFCLDILMATCVPHWLSSQSL